MTRSTSATYGLVICIVLGVIDIVSLAGLGADDGPPVGIVLLDAVLGVITLVGARNAWRGARSAAIAVIAARVISGLTTLPVFFVDDVPSGFVPFAVVLLVLTVIGVWLLTAALRRGELTAA